MATHHATAVVPLFPLVKGFYKTRRGRTAEVHTANHLTASGTVESASGKKTQYRWDVSTGKAFNAGNEGQLDIVAYSDTPVAFRCVWRSGADLDGDRCRSNAPSSGIRDCCCEKHKRNFYIDLAPTPRRALWEAAVRERSSETHTLSPVAFRRASRAAQRASSAPSENDAVVSIPAMYNRCRMGAEARGILFDLSSDDLLKMAEKTGYKCAVTGIPFTGERIGLSSRRPFAPSVDRIDSTKGYTVDNCRLVCYAVNLAMGEWGDDVVRRIALTWIQTHLKSL